MVFIFYFSIFHNPLSTEKNKKLTSSIWLESLLNIFLKKSVSERNVYSNRFWDIAVRM